MEIRRSKAERSRAVSRRDDAGRLGVTLVSLGTAVLAAFVLTAGGQGLPYREGQSVPRAVPSRVAFPVEDPEQTEEMRVRARDSSPNYYVLETTLLDEMRGRLGSALTLAKAHPGDADGLMKDAVANRIPLDESGAREILRIVEGNRAADFTREVEAALATLAASPIVRPVDESLRRTPPRAVLVNPQTDGERLIEMSALVFVKNTEAVESAVQRAVAPFPLALQPAMKGALLASFKGASEGDQPKPLYRFDDERTARKADEARAMVPKQYRKFGENELLADAGELTAAEVILLRAEQAAFRDAQRALRPTDLWLELAARTALVFLIVTGVASYITRFQRVPFGSAKELVRRVISAGVMLVLLATARFTYLWTDAPPHIAVGTQALAAGMLAIAYPPGVVFAVTAGLAMLTTMAVQQSLTFFLILMVVSGIFVFGLRDVRNRGRIVLVGVGASIAAALATICSSVIGGQPALYSIMLGAWAAGGALMAAFVLEGILPGIERAFRLSTGMTLLEWCDANKPLLRLMAVEAPGTYNHSLLVGALAESAAESIGANGLLARAGAYYHDIGKINKPEYFVENQTGGVNRHERLSPAMSLLIIIGHVKDGIEMAREYKLPASLRPFIAEHHGTTLVEYFYHAANKLRRADDPEVSDSSFRYPGPKPQSRETAIVMLSDGVEGAVRAMSEPTPGRIEALVSEIVRKRLMDGQFDECDLTFRELAEVEKSLVKSLCGIYHARVVYPRGEEEQDDVERGEGRRPTAKSAS